MKKCSDPPTTRAESDMNAPMRLSRAVAALLVAGHLTLGSFASAADPTPEDIAQARSLGEQGQAALDAKKYAEAEKLFSAAAALYPVAPTLPLGAARAMAGQGKLIQARETYNKIVREGDKVQGGPAAFKAAVESARAEADAIAPKIGSVTVTVVGPKEARVTLDDGQIPAAAWGLPRPIDPGSHKLSATLAGYKTAEVTFTVSDGAKVDQKLTLVKDDGGGAAVVDPNANGNPGGTQQGGGQPPAGNEGGAAASSGSSRKTAGFVVAGVGVVGVGIGAVTGLVAISDKNKLEKSCTNGKCPPSQQSNISSYNTMGTLSTVGFVVGGLALAGGVVLIVTAPKDPKAAFVSPYVGPGEAGLTGRF